jgi:hypothetical protein
MKLTNIIIYKKKKNAELNRVQQGSTRSTKYPKKIKNIIKSKRKILSLNRD